MACTTTRFTGAKAPCGRIVDGEVFQDEDEQAVVTCERDYDCGCRSIRHEYHDGSISCRAVRHDGRIVAEKSEYHT